MLGKLGFKQQAGFSLPQRNEKNCTQPHTQFKMKSLNKDTVSFNGTVTTPDAYELVSSAAKELKSTCAGAYLEKLGELIKGGYSGNISRTADAYSQMVEPAHVARIKELHNQLLADTSVKNIIKDGIRLTYDRKLGSDYR